MQGRDPAFEMSDSILEVQLQKCFWPWNNMGFKRVGLLCWGGLTPHSSTEIPHAHWWRVAESSPALEKSFLPISRSEKAAGQEFWLSSVNLNMGSVAIGARTYDHLKKTREEERLKRTMLSEVLQYIQDSSACQQWLSRQADMYGYSKIKHFPYTGIIWTTHEAHFFLLGMSVFPD